MKCMCTVCRPANACSLYIVFETQYTYTCVPMPHVGHLSPPPTQKPPHNMLTFVWCHPLPQVCQGLLWVWPDRSATARLDSAAASPAIAPELEQDGYSMLGMDWFARWWWLGGGGG